MQLDFNFTLQDPDGTEITEKYLGPANEQLERPISAKTIVKNFLISPASHEKIDAQRAWDFAVEVAISGIIETDNKGVSDFWHDFEKSSSYSILTKGNIKKAIDEAKKKSPQPQAEEKCEKECKS